MSRNELWGQSAQYFVVKGFSAGISLLGFVLLTRLLTTKEYGNYALVLTGVGVMNLVAFNWLKLGLLRFFPSNRDHPSELLSTVAGLFLALVFLFGFGAIAVGLVWPQIPLREFIWISVLLLVAQAWLGNNLEIARAELNPRKFGAINAVRAMIGAVFAVGLAKAGFGARGALVGLAIGYVVPSVFLAKRIWGSVQLRKFHRPQVREMMAYGIPLSITASLAFVLAGADRFMIKALIGVSSVGLYSSAYDLGHHTLAMICMTVGLAGAPLAINALERGGWGEAKQQYLQNGNLFLALAIPSAGGLLMTGPQLIQLLLGEDFRPGASTIFPWVVLGVLFQCAKFYYLDSAFYLHKCTRIQILIVLPAAVLNIVMNYLLLPQVGIIGAAWATAASYFIALVVTVVYVQTQLRMPVPWNQGFRILLAGLLMMLGLWIIGALGAGYLVVQVPLGIALYLSACWILGVSDIRALLAGVGRRLSSARGGP